MNRLVYDLGDGEWNAPELRTLLGEVLPTRQALTDFEVTHEFHNLGRRTMLLNARALVRGGDRPNLILLAIEDVTARRQAEDALRESEAWARAILDTAVDGIITIDARGTVASFNPAAERVFAYTAAEVIGQNVKMLMPAPYREHHDAYLANYLKTGAKKIIGIGREVVGQRRDGSTFPMDLSVSEFHDGNGTMFTGIVRDISERRRAQDQIRQRDAELARVQRMSTVGELASTLAHELNQPLTAVANDVAACAQHVRSGDAKPAKLLALLERAASEAVHAGGIIHHLRAFIEKREPRTEVIELGELLHGAAALLESDIARHRIVLTLVLDPRSAAHSRRPHPDQAGGGEPHAECDRGHAGDRRPTADAGGAHRDGPEWHGGGGGA